MDFPVRRSPGSRLLWALPVEAIAAISEGVQDALVRSGVGPARLHVVPSGIDLAGRVFAEGQALADLALEGPD